MKFFSLIFAFWTFTVMAQDTIQVKWRLERDYPIDSNFVWSVDALENVYICGKDLIVKYDSVGVLKYTQSIKSLGSVGQFEAINTMKLVHFSIEQQTLCFFDNTLTRTESCIDLGEHDIYFASMIATSSRPDKIWVLDNINSKLLLMDVTGNDMQTIETENLQGVLDLRNAKQIIERSNRLFILDSERGVYMFDIYGTLIDFIEFKKGEAIEAHDDLVFILSGDKLYRYDLKTMKFNVIPLPDKQIEEFRIENHVFFLRTAKIVHKYRI